MAQLTFLSAEPPAKTSRSPDFARELLGSEAISPSSFCAWLDARASLEDVVALLRPSPNEVVRIWPVGTAVNSVRNDGPQLLERLGFGALRDELDRQT